MTYSSHLLKAHLRRRSLKSLNRRKRLICLIEGRHHKHRLVDLCDWLALPPFQEKEIPSSAILSRSATNIPSLRLASKSTIQIRDRPSSASNTVDMKTTSVAHSSQSSARRSIELSHATIKERENHRHTTVANEDDLPPSRV
jgi:hypothetical protein